jgi:Iap family predicted aminopeptidase
METIQDPERDMLGRIYASDESKQIHHQLCSYGSRFAGTPSEKRAVNYLLRKLKEYGLTNVHTEEFTYNGWWRGTTKLEVTSHVHKVLPCIGLPWSPSTPTEGVEAELLSLGDGMKVDYELRGDEVPGKIVMTTAFSPPWMRGAHRCEKMGRAENLGAKGFIYMKNDPGLLAETGVATWSCPKEMGRVADFPAVGVSRETGAYLERLRQEGPVRIRITMKHETGPATGWNVVGDIVGDKDNGELLIVGAHFDGHDIAVGAMDDAAGTCVVMEAARVMARHAKEMRRTVRFILFPGEEVGCFGSTAYVNQHLGEMDSTRFMLNLDGAGRGTRPGILLQGFPEAIPFFRQLGGEMGMTLRTGVSFSLYSDHMPYALRGVETATLPSGDSFRAASGTRGFGHTEADTEDKVDLRDLQEGAAVVSRIMTRLGVKEELPMRRRGSEDVGAMLRRYELDEVMKVQRGWPSFLE